MSILFCVNLSVSASVNLFLLLFSPPPPHLEPIWDSTMLGSKAATWKRQTKVAANNGRWPPEVPSINEANALEDSAAPTNALAQREPNMKKKEAENRLLSQTVPDI